jgi:hypothetical protein
MILASVLSEASPLTALRVRDLNAALSDSCNEASTSVDLTLRNSVAQSKKYLIKSYVKS